MATLQRSAGEIVIDGAGAPVFDGSRYSEVMSGSANAAKTPFAVFDLQETSGVSFSEKNGGAAATCAVNATTMQVTGPKPWLPNAQAITGGGLNYIRRTNLGVANYPFTQAAWVRHTTGNFYAVSSANGNGDYDTLFRRSADFRGIARHDPTSASVTHSVTGTQSWEHLAVTFREDGADLYRNGQIVLSQNHPSAFAADKGAADDLLLGGFRLVSNSSESEIAQAGIWPALTALEIASIPAGPEPVITTHTAAVSGTTLTITRAANAYNNGSLTWTHLLQRLVSGSWTNVAETSGTSFTLSEAGDYRVWGVASNNGGASLAVATGSIDYAGPLPAHTGGTLTLSDDLQTETDTTTFDSQGNGTLVKTYSRQHEIASQWQEIDTNQFPTEPVVGRRYRFTVSARNDGGSDPAETQVSNVVTYVAPATGRRRRIGTPASLRSGSPALRPITRALR